MSINNPLEELVDEAVPPSGLLNCKKLHDLLHVIVANLADNINMNYTCGAGAKATQTSVIDKNQENVNQIKDQVQDLTNMSEKQKKMLAQLELKVKSLEEELNKVSKPGQSRPGRRSRSRSQSRSRSRSRSRSQSRSRTSVGRSTSKKPLKAHSCIEPKRSGEWSTWDHPGKPGSSAGKSGTSAGKPGSSTNKQQSSKMTVKPKQGDPKNVNNIQIPELKKWIETKLRSVPVSDDLQQRIDQLVKDKMQSTVIPDLKKMIESMINQGYKDQKGTQGKASSVPLCLSCQNAAGNRTQVSSQDCLCVIKRKLKNASKSSKMNVRKR